MPGTLADTENVIVDVGTGFYVEKVGYWVIIVEWLLIERFSQQRTPPSFIPPRLKSWVQISKIWRA